MKILEKIQKLPVFQRKIILWIMMIFLSVFLIFFWTKIMKKKWQELNKTDISTQFKIPDLKEKLDKNLPKIEIPQNIENLNQNLMGQ